jgi:uncharacterized membrane protein YjjP (DUF1212 family)
VTPSAAASTTSLDLLLRLGRGLHEAGFPTPDLELALGRVAERLGVRAQFFSTPTSLFFAFGEGVDQTTHLERVEPAGVDLGRLAALDALLDRVASGLLAPDEALAEIAQLGARPAPYPAWLTHLCWGVTSAATANFLGGGVAEIAVGAGLGLVTGGLARALGEGGRGARLLEPLGSALAAFLATGAAVLWPPMSIYIATLAGIIFLIPGFTLTVALSELAQRHLSAGTARFASALVIFLTVTFGTALGGRLGELAFGAVAGNVPRMPPNWTEPVALLVAPLALTVLFRAPWSAAPWILVTGFVGYQGGRLGGELLSPELGMFLGALAVGLLSSLYQRWTGRPSAVPLVPSILLLVPGSIGYKSLASLVERDVVLGIETAFRMILIAVSLVAGLLLASALAPERRRG